MIKFGPSGNSDSFYETCKQSTQAAAWCYARGLNAYEYSFARGTNISNETLQALGEAFANYDIEITVHAPYFINFAQSDAQMVEKSCQYILQSLEKMKLLKAKRLIFHPGSLTKQTRDVAMKNVLSNLKLLRDKIYAQGLQDFILCPETMGKHGQIGTVREVIEMCKIDPIFMPALDFGHINAYQGGSLKTEYDYAEIFQEIKSALGSARGKQVHIHFSKIEYGEKGELKHLTFADTKYGPEFAPLAKVLKQQDISAIIICESRGTQAEDAMTMKSIYEAIS